MRTATKLRGLTGPALAAWAFFLLGAPLGALGELQDGKKPANIVLARDEHVGHTGLTSSNNVYFLKTEEAQTICNTRIRFKARGDKSTDSSGEIMVSMDGVNWKRAGNWTKYSLQLAARKEDWHLLAFSALPRNWKSPEIMVRFSYRGGKDQLNIYEVVWENPELAKKDR
jgi:hypothetical protein